MKQSYVHRRGVSTRLSPFLLFVAAILLVLCSSSQLEVCLTVVRSDESAFGGEELEDVTRHVEYEQVDEHGIESLPIEDAANVEETTGEEEEEGVLTARVADGSDAPKDGTDASMHGVVEEDDSFDDSGEDHFSEQDDGKLFGQHLYLGGMDNAREVLTAESNQRLLEDNSVPFTFDLTDGNDATNLVNLVRFMDTNVGVCPPFGSPPLRETRANDSQSVLSDSHYELLNPFRSREELAREFGSARLEALRNAFMTLKPMNDSDAEEETEADGPTRTDFEGLVTLKLSASGAVHVLIPILLHDVHVDRMSASALLASDGIERTVATLRIDLDGATERKNAWLEQVDQLRQQRAAQQVYREKRRKTEAARRRLLDAKREKRKQRKEERAIAEGLRTFSSAQRERRHSKQLAKQERGRQRRRAAQTSAEAARCTNIIHAMDTLRQSGINHLDARYVRVANLVKECERSGSSPKPQEGVRVGSDDDVDPYRCQMFCGGACAASGWVRETPAAKGVAKDLSVAQVIAIFTSIAVYDYALGEVVQELEALNPSSRDILSNAQRETFRRVNLNDWIAERTYDIVPSDIWSVATHFVGRGGYAACRCPCELAPRAIAGFKYAYGVLHLTDEESDRDASSEPTRWARGYLLIREAAQMGSVPATSFVATAKEHGILTARDPVAAAKLLADVSRHAASYFSLQAVTIDSPHDADHLLRFERGYNVQSAWNAVDKPLPTVAQIADVYHQSLEDAKEESDVRKRLRGTVRAAQFSILGIKGVRRNIPEAECLLLTGIRSAGYLCDIEDTENAQTFVRNGRGGGCVEHRRAFQSALQEHLEARESANDASENKRLRRFRDVDRTCYPNLSHRYLMDSRETTEALEKALVYLSYVQLLNNASYDLAARYAYLSIQLMSTVHEDAMSKFKELMAKIEQLREEFNAANGTATTEPSSENDAAVSDATESADLTDDLSAQDMDDLAKATILIPHMLSILFEFINEIRDMWNVEALMDAAVDFDDVYNAGDDEAFDDVYERFIKRSADLTEEWFANSPAGTNTTSTNEEATASMLLSIGGVTAPGAYDTIKDPLRSGFIAQESLQLLAISVLGSWRRYRYRHEHEPNEDVTASFHSVEKYAMRYMSRQGHTCTASKTHSNGTVYRDDLRWEECAPRVAFLLLLQSAQLWRVEGKNANMLDGTTNSYHRADPFVLMADMLREGDIRIDEIMQTTFLSSKQQDRATVSLLPRKETETERSYAYRLLTFAMEHVSPVDPYLYIQQHFMDEIKEGEMEDRAASSPKFLWSRHDYGKSEEHHLPTLRFIRQRTLEAHQFTPLLYVSDMHYLLDTEKWTRTEWLAGKVWEGIVSFFDYTYDEYMEKRLAREVRVSSAAGMAGTTKWSGSAAANASSSFAHHVATLPDVRQYVLGAILLSYTFESGEPQGFSILMMEALSASRRNVACIRRFTDFAVHEVFLPQAREALWEEHVVAQWNAKKPKTAKSAQHLSLSAATPFRHNDREDRIEFLTTLLRYAADRLVPVGMRRSPHVGCKANKHSQERKDVLPRVEAAFDLLAMCTGVLVHERIAEGLPPLPDSYDGMNFPVGDLNCASALTGLIACYSYSPDEKNLPAATLLRQLLNTTTTLADHFAEYYAFTGKRPPGILHRFRSSDNDEAAKRASAARPADVADYQKLVESFRDQYDPEIAEYRDNYNEDEVVRADDRRLFGATHRNQNTERFEEIETSASRRRRGTQPADADDSTSATRSWKEDVDYEDDTRPASPEEKEEEEVLKTIGRKRVVEPWRHRILGELEGDLPVPDYGEGMYYNRRIHIITGTRMAATLAKWASWIANLFNFN